MKENLRMCGVDDAEVLAATYRDAVRNLGGQAYSEAQVEVWARYPEDIGSFRRALSAGLTLCIEVDGTPVAFGQLEPVDYIALLYCHSARARKGYASAILHELEVYAMNKGVTMLRVAASAVARPFFEHNGFRVIEEERPRRHGVEFLRYKMAKALP
jgi:GNAT superfamily N-acetyltransferase